MKHINQVLSLGAVLLLAPLTATFAQSTWQTVDDLQYTLGKGTSPYGVAATPDGALFVSGAAYDAANLQHGFVNRSLDGGATWDLVFDLPGVPGGSASSCWAVAAAPSGTLWATSCRNSTDWLTHWSADGGTTWVLSDFFRGNGRNAVPFCTAVDPAGRVFVGGLVWDAQGKQHFFVRRSSDNGATWKTVDDLAGSISRTDGIAATPAAVVSAGRLSNTWLVRRSINGGNTWTTTDTMPQASFAYGAAADANGNFYVVGPATLTANRVTKTHWLTRKSTDSGSTWRTVDDLVAGIPQAVTVDAFGRVFVAGAVGNLWTVRGSADGGLTWTTTDTFTLTPTGTSTARGVSADASGNVFVTGYAANADGINHGIVRKLATP